jgi:hypothetical protein
MNQLRRALMVVFVIGLGRKSPDQSAGVADASQRRVERGYHRPEAIPGHPGLRARSLFARSASETSLRLISGMVLFNN